MALFAGKNSIPGLENQLEKARAELSAAESAFAEAARSIENPPLELSDEQVSSLVDVRNGCEVRLVQAKVAFRRADAALNDASTAAAARERADALARVMSLGKAAQKVAREELTAATKGLRRTIRLMAEAEAAREELNASLPPEQRIEPFEFAVLGRPGIPEQVIKRERILKWVNAAGQSLFSPEEEALLIEDRRAGTAKLPAKPGSLEPRDTIVFRRRMFERTVRLPEVSSSMPGSLAETIRLPGLDGGPSGWNPTDTRSALRALAELEAAVSIKPPAREQVETILPVSPVLQSEVAAWTASADGIASDAA
jgi:hypothetical protein